MTDSGSFDSGDLIYATDLIALASLIYTKWVAAGLSGYPTSYGWSQGTGNTVQASVVNLIVADYITLWNLSSNKPGTLQSTVTAGNLIYGSLFQNMWTQLGQMTFTYSWADWPEDSEATLQGANTFAALMENPTADGDEAGQGCGLSGADLTLTRGGSVAGATGTPPTRYLNPGWFIPTANFWSTLLNTSSPWSFVLKFNALNCSSDRYLLRFADAAGNNEVQLLRDASYKLWLTAKSGGSALVNAVSTDSVPTAGAVYCAVWFDGTYIRAGFSTSKPTSWAGLDSGKRIVAPSAGGAWSGVSWAVANGAFCAGSSSGSAPILTSYAYYIAASRNSSLIGA